MRAGRDDHVFRLEAQLARRDDEAVVLLREPIDRDARLHGQSKRAA